MNFFYLGDEVFYLGDDVFFISGMKFFYPGDEGFFYLGDENIYLEDKGFFISELALRFFLHLWVSRQLPKQHDTALQSPFFDFRFLPDIIEIFVF